MPIVLKDKTEKKIKKKNWLTPKNGKTKFSSYFSFVLALKTIHAQMLFWSVFLKTHKKTLVTTKNSQNGVFDSQELFLCVFKNTNQKNISASIVFKAESKPKHE